jgi:immune inhibitor A
MIMIDFSDKKLTVAQTQEHYSKLWFEDGTNSVKDYYRDVSNGSVTITGKVVGQVPQKTM